MWTIAITTIQIMDRLNQEMNQRILKMIGFNVIFAMTPLSLVRCNKKQLTGIKLNAKNVHRGSRKD